MVVVSIRFTVYDKNCIKSFQKYKNKFFYKNAYAGLQLGPWGSLAILPAWGAGNLSSNLSGPISIG